MSNGVVFDAWWPWRFGRIIRKRKTALWVRWVDGEVWRYDRAHMQFLRAPQGGEE